MSVTSDGQMYRHDSGLSELSSENHVIDFETIRSPRKKKKNTQIKVYKSPREMTIYELNVYIKNIDCEFNEFNRKMRSYGWRRLKMKFLTLFCNQELKRIHKYEEETYKSWKSFVPYFHQQRAFVEMYRNRKEWEKYNLPHRFLNSIATQQNLKK